MRSMILSSLVWAITAAPAWAEAASHEPVAVSIEAGTAQLFVDDAMIASQEGLVRTLRQPRKDHGGSVPVIAAPPGTTLLAYGSIVRDVGLGRHVMFVQEFPSRQMYRCTSPDGMAWEHHGEGVLEPVTFRIDVQPEADARGNPGIDLFSCWYDERDDDTPYQGWLYLANYGFQREGVYYVSSRDGLVWDCGRMVASGYAGAGDLSCRTIHQAGRTVYGPGDVTLFARDGKEDRFLGIFKFFTTQEVEAGNNLRSRAYAFVDRLDQPFDMGRIEHVALLPPASRTNGDMPADEYYASTAWRYGSIWLGGLKVWHGQDDYPYSAAGCAFLKLVVSRDGLNWSKVQLPNDDGVPEVFIANGPEGGNSGRNDGGYISEFSQGPLRIGDELIYYYSASSFGKSHPPEQRIRGGGIFRARLRPDGFVSVDAGSLITPLLKTDGRRLLVNAVGPVSVAVATAGGTPVGSADMTADSLAREVLFDGRSLAEAAAGKPFRLRFTVQRPGRLYSFTVQ